MTSRRPAPPPCSGKSAPVATPVLDIAVEGEDIVLLTGAPGVAGALEVMRVTARGEPRHVGRLALPVTGRGVALHRGAAWVAAGAAGVVRVELDDAEQPRLGARWRPDAEDSRVRQVVDVVALKEAVVAMVAHTPRAAEAGKHADLLLALRHGAEEGIGLTSTYTPTAPMFWWGGIGSHLAFAAVDHIRVLDYQDASRPAVAAAPSKAGRSIAGLRPVGNQLAVIYDGPLMVVGHDLARGGRRTGDARLSLGGERRPFLVTGDDHHVLVADERAFAVVPVSPAPSVVRPVLAGGVGYRRLRPASRGMWLIDDQWRLSLRDHGGQVLGEDLLPDEMLIDIEEAGADLVGIVQRTGIVVLAPSHSGHYRLSRRIDELPEDVRTMLGIGSWTWLRGSSSQLVAAKPLLVGFAARAEPGWAWVGHHHASGIMRSQVHLEADAMYVAAGTLQRWTALGGDRVRRELPGALRWPPSNPALSVVGEEGRFLVGDTRGLVTWLDWRGDDAQVLWSLDMPGSVGALAQAGDLGWAHWSAAAPGPRGDGGGVGPRVPRGITALRLEGSDAIELGTVVLGDEVLDLHARGRSLWVLGADGAVSEYVAPTPRAPAAPLPTATPRATTGASATITPTRTPTATRAARSSVRVWLPWVRVE